MPIADKTWTIRTLLPSDASMVAALHISAIDTGFISSLGQRFVTALYRTLSETDCAFGLVAEVEGQVIGFVAFTSDTKALYRAVIRRGGHRLAGLLVTKLFAWSRCKRILETLCYPNRTTGQALPRAELLAIAVHGDQQGYGLGRHLVQQGLALCQEHGLKEIKVCVGQKRSEAQALYNTMGFVHALDITQHGEVSRVFRKSLKEVNDEATL